MSIMADKNKPHKPTKVQLDVLLAIHNGDTLISRMGGGYDGTTSLSQKTQTSIWKITTVTADILVNHGYIEEKSIEKHWLPHPSREYKSIYCVVEWQLSAKGKITLVEERRI